VPEHSVDVLPEDAFVLLLVKPLAEGAPLLLEEGFGDARTLTSWYLVALPSDALDPLLIEDAAPAPAGDARVRDPA
jgi:hypothetical protein